MDRTLIVARMKAGSEKAVSDIFAVSDATELPSLVGVRSRMLFRFHDLYLHFIEGERSVQPAVDEVRQGPLFRAVSEELAAYISPYDPDTWRTPSDAMATAFYHWQNPEFGTP